MQKLISRLAVQQSRSFSTKAVQAPLPYELSGLEPVLSGNLLDFHYNKHHKLYVTKYNEKIE